MDHAKDPTGGGDVAELLRRWFGSRDAAALDVLLQRSLPFLHRYAHGKLAEQLRSKEDTGDLVQEAVLDFLRYSPPFEVATEAQLRGLLCKIVDGVLSGHHRFFARQRRRVANERPLPDGTSIVVGAEPSPSRVASEHEREAALRLAIATLDPVDQRIVMSRVYDQAQFDAIGAEVGMKADTARVRFARAMGKLSTKVLAIGEGRFADFLA